MAKDLLDRKAFATDIPATSILAVSTLQFLQTGKQKQIFAITNYRYILHFIFWIEKQVFTTGHSLGIYYASYFY